MSQADKSYELKILKTVINNYLNESNLFTHKNIDESEAKRNQAVWDIATKIYQQSGQRVEFSLVRDIVDSRIRTKKHQLEDARRIAEQEAQQVAEEARRTAEAEKTCLITESDPQFLFKVTDTLGKFGGDEHKAKVFVRVREVISEHLAVEVSEISLDSHLSNHLHADEMDLVEVVLALEEEFGIEISEEVAANSLGVGVNIVSGGSWWNISSPSPSSFSSSAGEQCIVRNFVELICEKAK